MPTKCRWILLEHRAVTPAPSRRGAEPCAAIVPGVFPESVAAFLGIDIPTRGRGRFGVSRVMSAEAPTVRTPAENAAAAETTGSFSADVLESPSRLQASFFLLAEKTGRGSPAWTRH